MTGRPPYEPTDEARELVKMHTIVGTPQKQIAKILKIDHKTLLKYYRDEIDFGSDQANAAIGGALFQKAMQGDTASMIFWMKTRARWRETNQVDHTSSDGTMTPSTIVIKAADEAGGD